jgi:hypothetical protein
MEDAEKVKRPNDLRRVSGKSGRIRVTDSWVFSAGDRFTLLLVRGFAPMVGLVWFLGGL